MLKFDRGGLDKLLRNQLFLNSIAYGLSNALYTGLPLLLMPFLIDKLSPENYGTVDLFRVITMIMIPVLGLSTVQSVSRYFFDYTYDKFKIFVSTIIQFQIISGLLCILMLLCFSFLLEEKYVVLIYLGILYFIFNQCTEILLAIFRIRKQARKYMIFRLLNTVVDLLLLTIFFYCFVEYDWTLRIFPQVISAIILGLLSLWWIFYKEEFKVIFNRSLLKVAIVYSSPLILHMLSGYLLNIGDRFFILHFLDEKQLGSYSAACQITMIVSFFYTSFNLAWTPTFYEWMNKKKYEAIKKVQYILFVFIIILAFVSILFFNLISNFIPNIGNYNISYNLIIILVLSNVFLCFYKFNANYFFYNKQTKMLSIISFTSAIVAVILNYILIPQYGIMGAAISTFVTFLLMFLLVSFKKKTHEIL